MPDEVVPSSAPFDRGGKFVGLLDKALSIQSPVVSRYVERIQRNRPDGSPNEVIAALENYYLAGVTATGAGVGGVAAAPGVGTGAAIALSVGEVGAFFEASVLFSLAVGEVHGVQVGERRRTLVLAVLLGDGGVKVVEKAASRTGQYWGKTLTSQIPLETIRRLNVVLGRNFVTKYGTKQGIIVIGRIAPFGIGAMIGGAGNALMGRTVISAARRAFGPPPELTPT